MKRGSLSRPAASRVRYIDSGMILVGILQSPIPSHRSVSLLATLGAFSYSIYLWHMPVQAWGIPLVERMLGMPLDFGPRLVVYFGGSFCLGIVMAKLVEIPVLRLRDRWFPSRSLGAVDATPNQALHQTGGA